MKRRHNPKWTFWETWSEEKSYLLGFMYADGSVSNYPKYSKYGVGMTLKASDRYMLVRIRKLAGGTLCPQCSVNANKWTLNGLDIVEHCAQYGLIPNKTKRQTFPLVDGIDVRHFLRGYFDGDGSVGIYKKGSILSILGNKRFLVDLQVVLNRHVSGLISNGSILSKPGHFSLQFSTHADIVAIGEYLYEGATMYLVRKRAAFDELFSHIRGSAPGWTEAEDDQLRVEYGTISAREVASHLNRPISAIYSRAYRLRVTGGVGATFTRYMPDNPWHWTKTRGHGMQFQKVVA